MGKNSFTIALLALLGVVSFLHVHGLPASSKARQFNHLSFAIPGFSLGNQNNQLFGKNTVTRYSIRTTGTVTVTAFRTCTVAPAAGLMPCVNMAAAGRKKREASDLPEGVTEDADAVTELQPIEATPVIILKIGSTRIDDPEEVRQYLADHPPLPAPEDELDATTIREGRSDDATTPIYSSIDADDDDVIFADEPAAPAVTTRLPEDALTQRSDLEQEDGGTTPREVEDDPEKARYGIGGSTTVTTTINQVQVNTITASGPSATLTISYAGCSPPVFPVSTSACA